MRIKDVEAVSKTADGTGTGARAVTQDARDLVVIPEEANLVRPNPMRTISEAVRHTVKAA